MKGRSMEEMAPNLYALIPKRRRKKRTVQEALTERWWISDITGALSPLALMQYVRMWTYVQGVQLAEASDRLIWRLTPEAQYSSKSCYEALFYGATVSRSWKMN